MNCSSPGLPVHHQLLEFTQTHVHRVSDAIQSSHPLSSPSPPAPNPSQHQGLSNESALRIRWPKNWSFSFNISLSKEHQRSPLGWTGWISLQSKGLSRVFSNITVQKHQFFGAQLSSQSSSHWIIWNAKSGGGKVICITSPTKTHFSVIQSLFLVVGGAEPLHVCSMWNLRYPVTDQTHAPRFGRGES